MTVDTSKVLRLPRKLQHIFWKRRKSIAPATQNDFRHVTKHLWMCKPSSRLRVSIPPNAGSALFRRSSAAEADMQWLSSRPKLTPDKTTSDCDIRHCQIIACELTFRQDSLRNKFYSLNIFFATSSSVWENISDQRMFIMRMMNHDTIISCTVLHFNLNLIPVAVYSNRAVVAMKCQISNMTWRQQTKWECECMGGVESCKHAGLHLHVVTPAITLGPSPTSTEPR